jgi:predicted transcriptional regulator
MINFACKRFDLMEVIRCSFGIKKTEFEIVLYMLKSPDKGFTAKEISRFFKIGLSTAQKAISNLNKKGLIKRMQKNLDKGGYIFVYSIKEKSLLKQKIREAMSGLIREIENEVNKL